MKKLILGTALCALAGTLALAAPAQDRDDHHDRDEHHDNGKHKGWEKHEARADYRSWDHEHDRIVPNHRYPRGHYEHVKQVFVARSIDYRTRNVILYDRSNWVLYDRSNWVVASYDLDRCRNWQWDRDQVYVYDDDHHPGWYLLFNSRLGGYVHVEFSGVR